MNPILILLLVPVAVLGWRVIYSKSRWPRRIGAAAAAMVTLVGGFVAETAPSESLVSTMRLANGRDGLAVAAAGTGSAYLLLWGLRHGGRGRNKTLSILAALIGFVPVIASIAVRLMYGD